LFYTGAKIGRVVAETWAQLQQTFECKNNVAAVGKDQKDGAQEGVRAGVEQAQASSIFEVRGGGGSWSHRWCLKK
jgi:hypothetical protein